MEILNPAECMEQLSVMPVSRIAITVKALSVILPVNFAVVGGHIYFRTDPRSALLPLAASLAVTHGEHLSDAGATQTRPHHTGPTGSGRQR